MRSINFLAGIIFSAIISLFFGFIILYIGGSSFDAMIISLIVYYSSLLFIKLDDMEKEI